MRKSYHLKLREDQLVRLYQVKLKCNRNSKVGLYRYYVSKSTYLMCNITDKKAAKRIIKVAKTNPNIYSTADVMYAKLIKRRIKNDKRFSKDQTEQ